MEAVDFVFVGAVFSGNVCAFSCYAVCDAVETGILDDNGVAAAGYFHRLAIDHTPERAFVRVAELYLAIGNIIGGYIVFCLPWSPVMDVGLVPGSRARKSASGGTVEATPFTAAYRRVSDVRGRIHFKHRFLVGACNADVQRC